MDNKYGLLVICSVLLLACFVATATAQTWWYVDDEGGAGANFTRIQDAVNNATAGDTIIVRDGIYVENVDVNVNCLTIRSENGSASTVVRASNPVRLARVSFLNNTKSPPMEVRFSRPDRLVRDGLTTDHPSPIRKLPPIEVRFCNPIRLVSNRLLP